MGSNPSLFHPGLSRTTALISAEINQGHTGLQFTSEYVRSIFQSCSAYCTQLRWPIYKNTKQKTKQTKLSKTALREFLFQIGRNWFTPVGSMSSCFMICQLYTDFVQGHCTLAWETFYESHTTMRGEHFIIHLSTRTTCLRHSFSYSTWSFPSELCESFQV